MIVKCKKPTNKESNIKIGHFYDLVEIGGYYLLDRARSPHSKDFQDENGHFLRADILCFNESKFNEHFEEM